jgi:hypothetical protein
MVVEDKKSSRELDRLEAWVGDSVGRTLGPARGWMVVALRRELQDGAKPLPTLARRMGDVERRLAQSEAGDATTQRQQRIVDELDKLIKRLEEERKKQQQAATAGGGAGGAPTNPAEESRPSELKGPGEVDRKRLFAGDAWGALPPAERERLSQALQRDLPPQHRTLVEDYFRTLAEETGSADDAAMSDEGGTP